MQQNKVIIRYAITLLAIFTLAACANSKVAVELASETRGALSNLEKDGKRIIAADERTERLLAALAGARRQNVERTQMELGVEHQAGLIAKAKTDLVLRDLEQIVGENEQRLGVPNNTVYSPQNILREFPSVASPLEDIARTDKKLANLEKPLSFSESAKIYIGVAEAVGAAVQEAADNAEAQAAEASVQAVNTANAGI